MMPLNDDIPEGRGRARTSGLRPGDSPPLRFKITPLKLMAIPAVNTLIALFVNAIVPDSIFRVSFVYSQCVGISIAACSIAATNYFRIRKLSFQLAFISAAVIAGAFVGMAVGGAATNYLFSGVLPAVPEANKYAVIRSNLALALLFGGIISYVFFSLQKMSDEKIRRLEVEKNAVVTEIRLLQSQMEPHFLFNTLSTILGLIDSDPERSKRMLESFTRFLRASLVIARSETVTLSQEMDAVIQYLELFIVRMGERLRYRIDIPEDLRGFRIPPLIIQPLVENAVKHGLEPSLNGGELLITGTREGGRVRITVADSGLGINELSPGSGLGVENIKKRLDLVYGGRAGLVFEENRPHGLKAVIELPYETGTSDHS